MHVAYVCMNACVFVRLNMHTHVCLRASAYASVVQGLARVACGVWRIVRARRELGLRCGHGVAFLELRVWRLRA